MEVPACADYIFRQKQKRHLGDGALILQPECRMRDAYCSRFQLTRSPSVVVELETGAL